MIKGNVIGTTTYYDHDECTEYLIVVYDDMSYTVIEGITNYDQLVDYRIALYWNSVKIEIENKIKERFGDMSND